MVAENLGRNVSSINQEALEVSVSASDAYQAAVNSGTEVKFVNTFPPINTVATEVVQSGEGYVLLEGGDSLGGSIQVLYVLEQMKERIVTLYDGLPHSC